MRTIGRHHPTGDPNNYYAICGYCGVNWPRDRLYMDRNGLLVCPDEGTGASSRVLDEYIAKQSAERHGEAIVHRDGTPDSEATANPTPFNPPVP